MKRRRKTNFCHHYIAIATLKVCCANSCIRLSKTSSWSIILLLMSAIFKISCFYLWLVIWRVYLFILRLFCQWLLARGDTISTASILNFLFFYCIFWWITIYEFSWINQSTAHFILILLNLCRGSRYMSLGFNIGTLPRATNLYNFCKFFIHILNNLLKINKLIVCSLWSTSSSCHNLIASIIQWLYSICKDTLIFSKFIIYSFYFLKITCSWFKFLLLFF